MKSHYVYFKGVFQGAYKAANVNHAIQLYCADYQTTRYQLAVQFGAAPYAYTDFKGYDDQR